MEKEDYILQQPVYRVYHKLQVMSHITAAERKYQEIQQRKNKRHGR